MNDQERTVHFEARRTQWLSQLIEAVIFAQLVCKPGEHGVQELLKPILIAPEPGRPWWFHVSLDISEPGYNDKYFEAHDIYISDLRTTTERLSADAFIFIDDFFAEKRRGESGIETETFVQAGDDITPGELREPYPLRKRTRPCTMMRRRAVREVSSPLSPGSGDAARLDPVESPTRRRA
jgi:hypothetical protein